MITEWTGRDERTEWVDCAGTQASVDGTWRDEGVGKGRGGIDDTVMVEGIMREAGPGARRRRGEEGGKEWGEKRVAVGEGGEREGGVRAARSSTRDAGVAYVGEDSGGAREIPERGRDVARDARRNIHAERRERHGTSVSRRARHARRNRTEGKSRGKNMGWSAGSVRADPACVLAEDERDRAQTTRRCLAADAVMPRRLAADAPDPAVPRSEVTTHSRRSSDVAPPRHHSDAATRSPSVAARGGSRLITFGDHGAEEVGAARATAERRGLLRLLHWIPRPSRSSYPRSPPHTSPPSPNPPPYRSPAHSSLGQKYRRGRFLGAGGEDEGEALGDETCDLVTVEIVVSDHLEAGVAGRWRWKRRQHDGGVVRRREAQQVVDDDGVIQQQLPVLLPGARVRSMRTT
ncbi:hypothetical protein DFH09DRAFT_1280194 [Mycena vulgaris]|nr:hypothetical protein DFH09DRAFT_1280194 [Mycena vulgaris]